MNDVADCYSSQKKRYLEVHMYIWKKNGNENFGGNNGKEVENRSVVFQNSVNLKSDGVL